MLVAGVVVAVTSQLYAQPADPTATPAPATPPATVVSVKLSANEMSTRSTELEAQIKADDRHVQHLQALARRDKDVIKLTCVNDKYVHLKGEANVFDTQRRELLAALDKDSRFTTFDSMTAAADAVKKAREEADRCMGEPELGAGESSNSFNPPDIVDDPTGGLPFDEPGTVIEPPGYASPYS